MEIFIVLLFSLYCVSVVIGDLCPNVCVCKWKNGKQSVECTEKALITIPEGIDAETQVLDMSGNNLQVLPNETFIRAALLDLQKVYLRNCRIGQIDNYALVGLSNVVELDLSHNLLTSIPSSVFEGVPNLRNLSLAQNPIQKIDSNAFYLLPSLIKLDLSKCQIQTITSRAFEGIEYLESLKLSGNKLKDIQPKTLEVLSGLHNVELHDNPWHCDCNLRGIKVWLTEKNIPYPIEPICNAGPTYVINRQFGQLQIDDFACRPEIKIKSDSRRFVESTTGDNATIICRVESIPAAKISWYYNSRLLPNNTSFGPYQKIIVTETGHFDKKSSLILTNAQESDSNQFYCVAENQAGIDKANFTLRVTHRIAGFAMFSNSQVAGLSIALILLIFFIAITIIYLLFRVQKLPTNTTKQGNLRDDANFTNGHLNSPSKTLTISPIIESHHHHQIQDNNHHFIKDTNANNNNHDTILSNHTNNTSNGPIRRIEKIYNPDIIADARIQSDTIIPTSSSSFLYQRQSGDYEKASDNITYPTTLWNNDTEINNKLLFRNDDYPQIESNDKTPIIEQIETFQHTSSSYNNNRNQPNHKMNDYLMNTSFPTSLTSSSTNPKTLRIWQKGVQVLPPVNAIKRALSRNSPDEGYQEGCGTDV